VPDGVSRHPGAHGACASARIRQADAATSNPAARALLAGERPVGDVPDKTGKEDQAVPDITLDVPEQAPLDTGAKPVADDVDVDPRKRMHWRMRMMEGVSGLSGFFFTRTYSVALPFLPCFKKIPFVQRSFEIPHEQSDQSHR